MFGLGFGELCVIALVAMIVIGPRDLPKVMRKAGQWAGKLRRMAADARAQSGIDEILKDSTLGTDIHEIRKLARGELSDVIKAASPFGAISNDSPTALLPEHAGSTAASHYSASAHHNDSPYESNDAAAAREREYPRDGADSYRALPDTALAYGDGYPSSELANDPLYAQADVDAPPRRTLPPLESVKLLAAVDASESTEEESPLPPSDATRTPSLSEVAEPDLLP